MENFSLCGLKQEFGSWNFLQWFLLSKKKFRASSEFSRNLFISENYIGDGCYSYSFLFFLIKKFIKKIGAVKKGQIVGVKRKKSVSIILEQISLQTSK